MQELQITIEIEDVQIFYRVCGKIRISSDLVNNKSFSYSFVYFELQAGKESSFEVMLGKEIAPNVYAEFSSCLVTIISGRKTEEPFLIAQFINNENSTEAEDSVTKVLATRLVRVLFKYNWSEQTINRTLKIPDSKVGLFIG